jgi:3-hydroxyacyl-CoA dehydrogenase
MQDLTPSTRATASERLQREAMEEMAASLAMLAELGAMTDEAVARVLAGIRVVPEALATQALAEADVMFECVTETLDAKRDLPTYRKDVLARTLGALKHAGLFPPPRC